MCSDLHWWANHTKQKLDWKGHLKYEAAHHRNLPDGSLLARAIFFKYGVAQLTIESLQHSSLLTRAIFPLTFSMAVRFTPPFPTCVQIGTEIVDDQIQIQIQIQTQIQIQMQIQTYLAPWDSPCRRQPGVARSSHPLMSINVISARWSSLSASTLSAWWWPWSGV